MSLVETFNSTDIFFSFNSSLIHNIKKVESRESVYLNDELTLSNVKFFVDTSFNDSLKNKIESNFGYPIWDKILLFGDTGNKLLYLPLAKTDSKYVLAIMSIALDANGILHPVSFVPRNSIPQLIENNTDCTSIQNAKLFNKFDYELFNKIDNLINTITSLECDKNSDSRCGYQTAIFTYYVWSDSLHREDNGNDGGFYWEIDGWVQVTEYINVICEDILSWGFDFYSIEQNHNPNYVPGGGIGNPGGGYTYISEIEQDFANNYHSIQMQFNHNYVYLNNHYKNCGSEFGLGAKEIVSELFREIIKYSTPHNPNHLTEDQIVQILKDGLSNNIETYGSDLKTCIEASIELLAANGVYVSLNGALRTLADNAHIIKDYFENLCLFSEISEGDQAYLSIKDDAMADLTDFLMNCCDNSSADNILLISQYLRHTH